jgi:thioredoxin 1
MTRSLDLSADRPTILEIWTPTCVACRAMQPDLDVVAKTFSDRVDLKMINAAEESAKVRELGVRATPTLIGVREGTEVFRIVGRRSRTDLHDLVEAVGRGGPVRRVSRQDSVLRLSAGFALLALGVAGGPAWPLAVLGVAVFVSGIGPLLRIRRE